MSTAKITTDIKEIKEWAESKNGIPVEVKGVKPEDSIALLFDESAIKNEKYRKISWNEFGEKLESLLLAFQYEENDLEHLNFKFVSKSNN